MVAKSEAPKLADSSTANKKRAEEICARHEQMRSDQAPWRTQWQEIGDLMMPRKAGISSKEYTPDSSKEANLFDTTAGDAVMTMAGGLMSWTTPANEAWFNFDAPFGARGSDPAKQWFTDCSFRLRELLANSNFYSENHEDLLNHCSFGTSSLSVEWDGDGFVFESLPVGTFCISENHKGQVDTLHLERVFTAKQAKEKFGEEALPKNVLDALKGDKATSKTFTFIHAVYPRPEAERPKDEISRMAGWGKEFASCWVEQASKELVSEGGFDSFPFAVGRYLRWTALGTRSPYGYGPGFAALPDTRQMNFLQMMMDCMAEKTVRPAMIVPEEMEGDLILSAGGLNFMPSGLDSGRWPRPVEQTGDYRVGMDRVAMRKEAINAKFHVELFNMFAGLDRQMTAREVAERAAEKITLIDPAFSRLTSEKNTPLLRRLFALAAENGVFADPPEELVMVNESGAFIPDPEVIYTSRLALAIQQLRNIAVDRQLERDIQIAAVRPEILDNYDFDRITRDGGRYNGMPPEWFKPEEEVEAQRQAQAEAQQAAMAMEAMKTGSEAVRNVGGVEEAGKLVGA